MKAFSNSSNKIKLRGSGRGSRGHSRSVSTDLNNVLPLSAELLKQRQGSGTLPSPEKGHSTDGNVPLHSLSELVAETQLMSSSVTNNSASQNAASGRSSSNPGYVQVSPTAHRHNKLGPVATSPSDVNSNGGSVVKPTVRPPKIMGGSSTSYAKASDEFLRNPGGKQSMEKLRSVSAGDQFTSDLTSPLNGGSDPFSQAHDFSEVGENDTLDFSVDLEGRLRKRFSDVNLMRPEQDADDQHERESRTSGDQRRGRDSIDQRRSGEGRTALPQHSSSRARGDAWTRLSASGGLGFRTRVSLGSSRRKRRDSNEEVLALFDAEAVLNADESKNINNLMNRSVTNNRGGTKNGKNDIYVHVDHLAGKDPILRSSNAQDSGTSRIKAWFGGARRVSGSSGNSDDDRHKVEICEDDLLGMSLNWSEDARNNPPPDDVLNSLLIDLRRKMHPTAERLDLSDEDLKLFLRNRNWHVRPALALLKQYSKWYARFDLTPTLLTVDRVENMLLQNVIMSPPGMRTRKGNRIMFMRPGLYFPKTMDLTLLMEASAYIYERVCTEEEIQQTGFTFVADMRDWTWDNFSVKYAAAWFHQMQFRFPVPLSSWLMVDTPPWFSRVWIIIRPMMSASFASKWEFYTRDTILEAIDADNLPEDMGGTYNIDMEQYVIWRRRVEDGEIGYTDDAYFASPNDFKNLNIFLKADAREVALPILPSSREGSRQPSLRLNSERFSDFFDDRDSLYLWGKDSQLSGAMES
ncbi:Tyrosine-protein phosphatase non-receptor type 9 [Porphyridium purpureum]|uniref:Tyrosine-protein phosphatase non-receptor type 9 n=1 Tax=Porphyridium purpureum TaxID=35688 RepID=A0A5J4YV89_PORPP|nr:Tyrosine-protein phosphatase non-receptor type 9 [Porphyridium purpureum]|eukprot:POR8079..scf227_4